MNPKSRDNASLLDEMRRFLTSRYRKLDPSSTLRAINSYEYEDVLEELGEDIITDMYLTHTLAYVTIEKEDPTLKHANLIRVFSFTRGLDIISIPIMRDALVMRYGDESIEFPREGMVICAPYAPGIWRAGVLLFLVDEPKPEDIEDAITFSEVLTRKVSTITIDDLWKLAGKEPEALEDIENFQSRIFEMEVERFLRREYGYFSTDTRLKPPYLEGKEIDVIARKDVLAGKNTVTICECKLRFNDTPITKDEIQKFAEKFQVIREHEAEKAHTEGRGLEIYGWFVTNTHKLSERVIKLAKDNNVELRIASLPKNWKRRSDWKVLDLLKATDKGQTYSL